MIGIISAMEIEMDALRSRIQYASTRTVSGITFTSGTLEGVPVVAAVCGVGKVFAAICAQTMIMLYHPDIIINSGVAGSLTPALPIGSVAVSTAVVQYDMDTSAIGDPVGMISGLDVVELYADHSTSAALIACSEAMGLPTLAGVIGTGDQFINDAARKQRIVDLFGAIACDMEGGAIAQACHINGLPFCILRVISDGANGESAEDYPTFSVSAADTSIRLMCRYMRSLSELCRHMNDLSEKC